MPYIRDIPPIDRPVNGTDTLILETDEGTRIMPAIQFKGDPGATGTQGPAGPAGTPGPSTIGGAPISVSSLAQDDLLQFNGLHWQNSHVLTLTDGGNF